MKIFIQGRKDGYNTLYPKPTPAEFFQFAADIQRIDAQNNVQYYGKSLYAIAFNGSGCIYTKYIIGYDTLRSNIGNIGISVFIPSSQKMPGTDIKTLLDELIKIYTTNYCPDFKLNNQKQEDWLLFSSAANNFDAKVKTFSSDENFQYGNKDAAYVFFNNVSEIEKYLDSPYQLEYKEYKQIFFLENQSQLLLEVIKHDQTANLTGKIDLENPQYKLRDYYGKGTNGVTIEIRANGKLRNNNEKIFKKDSISIKYSKKYHKDIFAEGKLSEPQIAKYLKIYDNSADIDVEKNVDFKPILKSVEIKINNSKGETITDATISCKSSYTKREEKPDSQNTIVFSGEDIKDKWSISARKDGFSGEDTFIPELNSLVKLTLKEVKPIKIQVIFGATILKTIDLTFNDDEIRNPQTEKINIPGYQLKEETFIPKDIYKTIFVELKKQVNQQPLTQGPKGGISNSDIGQKEPEHPPYTKIIIGLLIVCLLGVLFFIFRDNIMGPNKKGGEETPKVLASHKLTPAEIVSYVEGDSLFLNKLEDYKKEWEMLKDSTDIKVYTENKDFIDRAIKKREKLNERDFPFLKDSSRYIGPQMAFKNALDSINPKLYVKVKEKLPDVSELTLTEIAKRVNEILADFKNQEQAETTGGNSHSNKVGEMKPSIPSGPPTNTVTTNTVVVASNSDTEIINYLKGVELKIDTLNKYFQSSIKNKKLNASIKKALDFWELDGDEKEKRTYFSYYNDVKGNNYPYLKDNITLINFLESQCKSDKPIYPKGKSGVGKTLTLSKFISKYK
jgi:hypothetical protein